MNHQLYKLKIGKIKRETANAVTLTFDVPADLKEVFSFKQGQYVTVNFKLNGEEERRAYSLCTSPMEGDLSVTIKKVDDGKISTLIHNNLKVGDTVEVMPPEGRFYTDLKEEHQKSYYLIGAGSGITPLMSILKTILEKEPRSSVSLLYGNRDEDSIIFREELEQLEKKYKGQFFVEYILSKPKKEKEKGFSGIFKKAITNWQGKTGRISAAVIADFLENHPPRSKEKEYFLCGPGEMIKSAEAALMSAGVASANIHKEYFTLPDDAEEHKADSYSGQAKAIVHLDGSPIELMVPQGKTVLEALQDEGYDPPYSCTSGSCSTCMAKLLKGKVDMDVCLALSEDEVQSGYILTCQSHPVTPEIELTYDV